MNENKYFADYDTFSEYDIINITSKGIALKNGALINFDECTKKYKETHALGENILCVGERDITDLSFMFYSSPKPIMIKFVENNKIIELFSKRNTHQRFHDLQKRIIEYGYRTYDMS